MEQGFTVVLAARNQAYDDAMAKSGVATRGLATEGARMASALGQSIDKVATSATGVGPAITSIRARMESEMPAARAAVDALGQALGADLVAKLDAAGVGVEEFAQRLRDETGASFEDIEASAEELADSIRALDAGNLDGVRAEASQLGAELQDTRGDVERLSNELRQVDSSQLDQVGTRAHAAAGGVRQVGVAGGQARNVLANLGGNAAQDLAQLGGVAGTTGVALGQLAEYTADGNIKLAQFAKLIGPIAVAGVVLEGVKTQLSQVAEIRAWEREQVDGYFDAIREGISPLDAMRAKLEETGQLSFKLFQGVADVDVSQFVALGLDAERMTDLVEGGFPAIKAWSQHLIDAGANATDVRDAAFALGQQVLDIAEAERLGAASAEFFTNEIDAQRAAHLKNRDAMNDHYRGLGDVNEQYDTLGNTSDAAVNAELRHFDSLGRLNSQYDNVGGSTATATGTTNLFADAIAAANDELLTISDTYARLTGTLSDESAYLGLQQSVDDVVTSFYDLEKQIKDGSISAEEGHRRERQNILDLEKQTVAYGEQVGLLPEDVTTLIMLLDQGKIDEYERKLAALERERHVNVLISVGLAANSATGNPTVTLGLHLPARIGDETATR